MAEHQVTYETDGASVWNVQIGGKPLTEASHAELVDLVPALISRALAIHHRVGSPGLERRAWAEKPPEERKPGAPAYDTGGIR